MPKNVTFSEKKIHKFLDLMNVNQINIKQYIETFDRVESPNVDKIHENKS
jgi:hypothetical protein